MMKIWFLNTFVAIALFPAIPTHAESLPPAPSPAGAPSPSGEVSNINQAGSIQVNGYSGQNVPNCGGGCIYTTQYTLSLHDALPISLNFVLGF